MHVDVLGPVSVNPRKQEKVTIVPFIAGSLSPSINIMKSSAADASGCPQLAVREQS